MTVLSSYNREEEIIPEGYSVEYGGTYCRLIIMKDEGMMHTADLTKDLITRELEVTSQLNVKGFLGVTLKDLEGNVFGTLCVMDREEKQFTEDDINYLKSMADLLSHIIDLDKTKYYMGFLSVPTIPITSGVSILSLQGIVDENRSEQIMGDVLQTAAEQDIRYFIVDLSKLVVQDDVFPNVLINMIQALQLMGVDAIIMGVTPAFDMSQFNHINHENSSTKFVTNIKMALDYIGYSLVAK